MTFPIEDGGFLVTARGLNEYVYCPRLYHLMYVQGLFDDSVDTVEGTAQHARGRKRPPGEAGETPEGEEPPWPASLVRQVQLTDAETGITGKFDAVEWTDGRAIPVEDKRGPAPERTEAFLVGDTLLPPDAWANDQVQLAAQMALLRANGQRCDQGRIYYRKTKTTAKIPWTPELEAALRWSAQGAAALHGAPMPDPLRDSPKCVRCSLNHICLPDETWTLREGLEEPRRLHPGREDAGVLYIATPGAVLGKDGDSVRVTKPGEPAETVPLHEVGQVCVAGAVQVSTQLLHTLAQKGATVAYLSYGGWLNALTTAPVTKNVHLRRAQFVKLSRPDTALVLARSVVRAKIANQRTLLRRNRQDDMTPELRELKRLQEAAAEADRPESLLGMEGVAAKIYWEGFAALLEGGPGAFEMAGRNRRPPKDPVNAMLSYGYTLLLRDFAVAITAVGMDPLFGFYHAVEAGRPSLALDLMEAFRPIVVDSAVLRAVNERVFAPSDFITVPGCSSFKPHARKKWIEAYERRVDELVTHPAFGYRLSYRRVFHLEARLLARFLEGDIPAYEPLTTR